VVPAVVAIAGVRRADDVAGAVKFRRLVDRAAARLRAEDEYLERATMSTTTTAAAATGDSHGTSVGRRRPHLDVPGDGPLPHTDCPHGDERETCEYGDVSHATKYPSSRSPHQVRTGSITWQLNRGVPIQVVAERVNTSVRTLKEHYDQPTKLEELEERRRPHIDRLDFDEGGERR